MGSIKKIIERQKALKYKNYRLYMSGQGFSVMGTWVQRIAMMWLAYRLSNSAFLLGVITFSEQIPILFLAPIAGVYADRWDKHKALIWFEIFSVFQAALLAFLTFTDAITITHLVLLSLLLGFINAFEIPLRQSFVVDMVNKDKAALPEAIALNSVVFNSSRLIGPAIAGVLISGVGEAWCFVINSLSYSAVTISLLMMRLDKAMIKPSGEKKKVFNELKLGFQYITNHKRLKPLLILLTFVSFTNAAIKTLGPVFAKDILKGDADTFGLLMSAVGVGAIGGALFLSKGRKVGLLAKIISYTALVLGVGMVAFSFSTWLPFSLLLLAVCGLAKMMHNTSTNTLLQVATDDDKRGRVMSFYAVCTQGMTPIGGLVAGSVAGIFGGVWAMFCMGGLCVLVASFYQGRKIWRYRKKKAYARSIRPNDGWS